MQWRKLKFLLSLFIVQLLSHVWLFATPWIAARQASPSFSISWSLLKLVSIESVMPSNHLLCRPLLFLPSIFLSIMVFSCESALHIRWPKYWSFSFSISPSNECSLLGLITWPRACVVLSHLVMSDSLWSHGLEAARLLCPWNFPRQEWIVISYSRGSSPPRDRTHISFISCIGRQILYQ